MSRQTGKPDPPDSSAKAKSSRLLAQGPCWTCQIIPFLSEGWTTGRDAGDEIHRAAAHRQAASASGVAISEALYATRRIKKIRRPPKPASVPGSSRNGSSPRTSPPADQGGCRSLTHARPSQGT